MFRRIESEERGVEWRKEEEKTQVQVSLVNTKKTIQERQTIWKCGKCYAPSDDKCCKKFYDRSSLSLFSYWVLRQFIIIRRPSINQLWTHTHTHYTATSLLFVYSHLLFYFILFYFLNSNCIVFFFCFCVCVYKTWSYSLYDLHAYVCI